MEAPKTAEQAIDIAKKLGLEANEVLRAFGIISDTQKIEEHELRNQLAATTDIKHMLEIFLNAPYGSKVGNEILQKILDVATEPRQADMVRHFVSKGNEFYAKAVRRIVELTRN